jgi:hypothetical protein
MIIYTLEDFRTCKNGTIFDLKYSYIFSPLITGSTTSPISKSFPYLENK